jgi:D-glycero-D-manno-heptose 1,7-bisphosphate phosphatase
VCDGYFIDIGVPQSLEQARRELPALMRRRVAFLRQDCLIRADHGNYHQSRQVEWIRGAPESIRRLNDLGCRVIVVSNLPCGARRCFDEQSADDLHRSIQEQSAALGSFIDAFQYWPRGSEAGIQTRQRDFDQKIDQGMIFGGLKDFSGSFMISDKQIDIEAAKRMGITGYLFDEGDLAVFLEECLADLAQPKAQFPRPYDFPVGKQ